MSKVRIILRMYAQGVSKSSISEKTGTSRNTVKKYIRDFISLCIPIEEIESLQDNDLESLFLHEEVKDNSPRYKAMLDFFPQMEKALKSKGMTQEKQWDVYISLHPTGYRKSQFKLHYNRWSHKTKSIMRVEHKSGDKMYVDYAGSKLEYIDRETGEVIPVEVFVAILGASQLTYIEASMTQQKEDFIGSCENALYYFGGAPQAIVTDNLKSAVTKSSKYEPTLNEAFKGFADHYSMTVLPAKPYRPTYKALVEGMVKIMYRTIYVAVKANTHFSLEELNQGIRSALEELNKQMLSGRPYSRRQLFEETENGYLQALPVNRYEAKRKQVVKVQKNNHVCLVEDKHYYSVPYNYIGQRATILYNQSTVDIYIKYEQVATYQRNRQAYRYTTIEGHLAYKNRYATDWTPEKFIERAAAIGGSTKEYIIKVLSLRQHPEQAYKSCQGILSYAPRVGNTRLENACARALYYKEHSYQTIRAIIEKGLDKDSIDTESELRTTPTHENIRGNMYFK